MGTYVTISKDMVLDNSLTHGAKILYLTLKVYMNQQTKTCFPGIDTLAMHIGCTHRTVRRNIKLLESLGYIEYTHDSHYNRKTFTIKK